MLKKMMLMLLALAGIIACCGGEFQFAANQSGPYGRWSKSLAKFPGKAALQEKAGVNGSNALVIADIGQKRSKIAVEDVFLIPGQKYRFGGWVRTQNLKARRVRFVIHNNNWRRDMSTRAFPANTNGKWVKVEWTGIAMPTTRMHTFCIHIDAPKGGKLEISSPYIEAVKPANQLEVQSYSFTAKTDPGYKSAADPNFRKLTDGIFLNAQVPYRAQSGRSVLWRHKFNGGKGPVITFNFATAVKIEKVNVHYYRWKTSYGIKEIRLVGVAGDKRQVIGNLVLNHPYTKPASDPFFSVAELLSASEQKFNTVELHFRPSGGWISLNEVEFFGKADPIPQAAKVKAPAAAGEHPLAAELISKPAKGLQMSKKEGMIVLENDQVIYVLDPGYTGSVNFAWDRESKSNQAVYAKPKSGFGPMFCDRLYPGNYEIRDMYRHLPYEAEILADTPAKKQVRLTGTGRNGIFRNVKMVKTYTLYADSPVLHVDQAIQNGMDNVIPLRYGYWMCGGSQSPNGCRLVFPTATSVDVYNYVRQLSVREISSGWMAAMDGKSDSALALMMPYDLLSEFYFWRENNYIGTIEFKLGVYPIKAGDELRFKTALVPFSKIGIPSKVTEIAAVSFGDLKNKPELKMQLFDPKGGTLRISAGFLNKGKVVFKPVLTKAIPAGTRRFQSACKVPAGQGTLVLKAELLRNNTVVMFAETSAIIGKGSGVWRLTPDCERKPDVNAKQAKADLDFHSLEVETPHIKWGKPYAGGKPKVLAINNGTGGIREMVELAQRFDIELTTNYTAGLWALSGHVMSLNVKDCIAQLGEKLKKPYDVIVVAGLIWKHMSPAVSSMLLEKVASGTGLVVISPESHPQALQELFRKGRRNYTKAVRWKAAGKSDLLTGIPFDILPPTRVNSYDIRKGEVLATADKRALAAQFKYGKGKVFLATYLDKVPISNRNSTFFLPFLHFNVPDVTWHYYEYHHAMLAKLIYAAAGKESGVQVSRISAQPKLLTLELCGKAAGTAEVAVTLRDKFSRTMGSVKQKVQLTAAGKQLKIALPESAMNGLHFADTVISTAKGKAWWGTAYFENPAAGKLTEVNLPDRVFRQEEKIAPQIKISGTGKVVARLYDNCGNVFAQSSGAAPVLPLADCLSATCKLEVSLMNNGREVDRFVKDLNIWRKSDTRFFLIAQGWPGVREKTPLYLTDFYTGMMHKNYGINCTSGSVSSWDSEYVVQSYRRNNVLIFSREIGVGTGGKYPYNTNLKKPTKFQLVRRPCLSDPAVLENIRISPARKPRNAAYKYGNILAAGADEANMFGGWDGCFSPHCMKAIRIWLRKVYGSLDRLNASWKTSFKNWDEVIPMTEAEVRNHSSYAPWVDHRTFNDIQRAAAIGIQTAAIEKHSGLWLSLSGTSDTNPWNAWDFYRIMPHMKALAGYFGEQTIQHRSFAKNRIFSMPWIGYDVAYDSHDMMINRALMNGVSGLNIYGTFYIGPDWRLPKAGKELKKVLSRYLDGRADAVMHFDMKVYPIVIHYSPASIKVNYLEGKNDIRISSTTGFRNILSDCSLNYNYLAYGDIEQGKFGKNKVIFLPMSAALSDAEVKNLKAFVKNGGILIADMGAGHFDDHGVRRADQKDLLEIFGLAGFGSIRKIKGVMHGKDKSLKGIALPVENAEIGVRPATARALARVNGDFGSMDAVYVNSFGKGKAIYLAADLTSTIGNQGALRYTGKYAKNTRIIEAFFRKTFADAGITPLIKAPTLRSTELLVRERNGAYIAGFVRDIDQTKNTETAPGKHIITTARKFYAWDLLERRYLGYGTSFKYEFGPVTQSIWVFLTYKPEALTAKVSGKERSWKITLAFKADTREFTRHIINISLKDPSGKVNSAYSRKVIMDNGKCDISIKLPLNYPAKGWTLEAEDVLTQCRTAVKLK